MTQKVFTQVESFLTHPQEVEQVENQECDNLLNFASSLDFDKYLYDVEVRSMISSLKKRIDELTQQPPDDIQHQNEAGETLDPQTKEQRFKDSIQMIREKRMQAQQSIPFRNFC